jgi:phosphoribosylformylglycinamidine synthase
MQNSHASWSREKPVVTLWQIDISPAPGQPDVRGSSLAAEAADLGLCGKLAVAAAHGFLVEGDLDEAQVQRLARELLADSVVESATVAPVGDERLNEAPGETFQLVHVLYKPGVMDPVADSTLAAINDFGFRPRAVRTFRKYWIRGLQPTELPTLCSKLLANDSIEQAVVGPLHLEHLELGSGYSFQRISIPLRSLDDDALVRLSREGQLYLTLVEMQTIQRYFQEQGRDPTDIELETVAQTWSEHCSHKTLAGRIAYRDENGERRFHNMLKETIFAATQEVRAQLGQDDWCVSVFKDNAGVVRFDEHWNVAFKVETHNHPSALEPYGGANTGVGGVIRDTLGTGLGAKPICNTDVFCFAPPNLDPQELPPGVLHPRRVMRGVVAGVRDYGNRMGIPTINGALFFDRRYLGNPLVYCGNVGLLPRDKSHKKSQPGDWIVAIGGRTGRDGIHGATFSSAELTSESESISGGAVQIGNAITEKMVLDVLLQARDRGLFTAVTDCGAGGFSSAVGEMGEEIGAEVWLDRAPLKYDGLSYTEIWISEAQERMVLSVPPHHWDELRSLCAAENVEATILGKFVPTGRLELRFHGINVGELSMEFLHQGRPPVVRDAVYQPNPTVPLNFVSKSDYTETLLRILGSFNVASKEWVIRQYDHEVQGGSVVKPLVGVANDGPSDAAVVRPVLSSQRGLVISCGMNPRYGDFDTYDMATSAVDEAVRNCVAVGADPKRIAILDNFCWGYTDRPETLGSLVRAALGCHDAAVALGTPFISGKDSLNNEFTYEDAQGQRRTISIPPSLLISAMGQIEHVDRCVTMDFKKPESLVYLVGITRNELGGSHFSLVEELTGGQAPRSDLRAAPRIFNAVHTAIQQGLISACHDLSEGGLAVAAAEMAFAGGIGAELDLHAMPHDSTIESSDINGKAALLLFAESNTRFLCEIEREKQAAFETVLGDVPFACLGKTTESRRLRIQNSLARKNSPPSWIVDADLETLKEAWQAPLRW